MIPGELVDDPVKGSLVHLFVRMIRAEMTGTAGLRVPGFLQRKPVGGMAAIAPFLDDMAALAKSGADFCGNGEILPLTPHPLPGYGMPAPAEFFHLFGMTFPAFLRKDHGFLFRSHLVVDMAGHAVDALLGMFGFHPGLEETWSDPLVAFHAESWVQIGSFVPPTHAGYARAKKNGAEKDKSEDLMALFHLVQGSGNLPNFSLYEFFQCYGVIQFFLLGGKEKGHGSFRSFLEEQIKLVPAILYLLEIPFLKLGPLCRIMAVPFPQFIAGGDIPQPEVHLGLFLAQAPGPKAVYQDTETIPGRGRLVDSLNLDHGIILSL